MVVATHLVVVLNLEQSSIAQGEEWGAAFVAAALPVAALHFVQPSATLLQDLLPVVSEVPHGEHDLRR